MSNNWPKVKLGEVLRPISRPVLVEPTTTYSILGAHWYAGGLYTKDILPGSQIQAKNLYRVEKGDFVYNRLFGWKGSFAVASNQNHNCFVSNEFPCFLVNSDRADGKYLWKYFSLPSVWDQILSLSTGGTPTSRNRLKEDQLLDMDVSLPPATEQRQIVARIEELAAKIEEARDLRKQAMEEAEVLWAGGAKRIFERTEEQFPLRSLADVVSIAGGGTPSKANPFYWSGSIPWITPKDMKVRELHDSIDHISEQASVESPAKLIKPGAVLVVVRGMILAHTFPSAILRVPATINQDMKALTPKPDLLPEYVCAFFWAFNDRVLALVEKSTHDTRKLETPVLMNTKLAVPPVPEQRRIVARLGELQQETDSLEALQAETSTELDAFMPSILAKAFRGEL